MHILLVNDDGPPSKTASPYILSLVRALQAGGHTVSVILPHIQRSWIGKAHFIGQLITPTYYQPPGPEAEIDSGTTHESPLPANAEAEEWVLVDGTPATCTQLGLQHFFRDRGPIDLVVSGPNYGRNTTSLFALSSGTLGGAMEAVALKKRAIALSYAFDSREINHSVLAAASKHSVRVIEHLTNNWGNDVEVYSVNVPLVAGVDTNKVLFTDMLENYWTEGGVFDEVEVEGSAVGEGQCAEETEQKAREKSNSNDSQDQIGSEAMKHARHRHRQFKWAPRFTDVHRSVEQSKPGNDGWAVRQGFTSITPLRATFTAARAHRYGEVNLGPPARSTMDDISARVDYSTKPSLYVYVAYEDPYVQPMILSAINTFLLPDAFHLVDEPSMKSELPPSVRILQILPYESLPHEALLEQPQKYFGNSYIIRKALIRKHYLSHTVASWSAKNPQASLQKHVPLTIDFELDYAEFLDDALVEAWEVKQAWERNIDKPANEQEWWILKPSMSDKGQGIRLFSSQELLQAIFDGWEEEEDSDDEEEEEEEEEEGEDEGDDSNFSASSTPRHEAYSPIKSSPGDREDDNDGIRISQLRHFTIQPYIAPLLIPAQGSRKFHIRSYVLAVGALQVYVYAESLALHSAQTYTAPHDSPPNESLAVHLTNTFVQGPPSASTLPLVSLLSALPTTTIKSTTSDGSNSSGGTWSPLTTQSQINDLTSSLFRAAAQQPTTFQPLPNCFEVYGVDWLVDADGKVWLLEVNAYPDFAQTGPDLAERVVAGFWRGVIAVVARYWFPETLSKDGFEQDAGDVVDAATRDVSGGIYAGHGMWKVLDLDMGRR